MASTRRPQRPGAKAKMRTASQSRDEFELLLDEPDPMAAVMRARSEQNLTKLALTSSSSSSSPKKSNKARSKFGESVPNLPSSTTPPSGKGQKQATRPPHRVVKRPAEVSNSSTNLLIDEPPSTAADQDELEVKIIQAKEATIKSIASKKQLIKALEAEVQKMVRIFQKLVSFEEAKASQTNLEESEPPDSKTSTSSDKTARERYRERMEQMEKGPFNIVFHGLEPDWIEEEMADDPDFKRDVLEQRVKKLIKDEAGMVRDVPLVDCYRYYEGPRIRDSPPVVVSFKNRKDKEHVLWRSKDKLRKIGVLITEDSTSRLAKMSQPASSEATTSPKKSSPSKGLHLRRGTNFGGRRPRF